MPLRITALGLASIVTTPSAWRNSQRSAKPRFLAIRRSNSAPSPWTIKRNALFLSADFAMPSTTAAGPRSPPMASIERTVPDTDLSVSAARVVMRRLPSQPMEPRPTSAQAAAPVLGGVFVEIDLVGLGNHFAVVVIAAGGAHMVGRFSSPQLGHSLGFAPSSASWARRILRFERVTRFWGTAMSQPQVWGGRPPRTGAVSRLNKITVHNIRLPIIGRPVGSGPCAAGQTAPKQIPKRVRLKAGTYSDSPAMQAFFQSVPRPRIGALNGSPHRVPDASLSRSAARPASGLASSSVIGRMPGAAKIASPRSASGARG